MNVERYTAADAASMLATAERHAAHVDAHGWPTDSDETSAMLADLHRIVGAALDVLAEGGRPDFAADLRGFDVRHPRPLAVLGVQLAGDDGPAYVPPPKHEAPVPSEHHRDDAQRPIERRDIDPRRAVDKRGR